MKISMIPDNSVKTIHASQGDTEREWEFELYDNEGLIDTSSIGQQTVYPVYAGGTEEVLPANTAVPVTSPMLADIQYPDQLRLEQYFTYRQCPTASDGKAKVKKMYGNSIVFNQLVQNGNFADTSGWTFNNGTGSASGNVLTYTIATQVSGEIGNRIIRDISLVQGHIYLFVFDLLSPRTVSAGSTSSFKIYLLNSNSQSVNNVGFAATANAWEHKTWRFTASQNIVRMWLGTGTTTFNVNDVIKYKNIMCIDLTLLFGSGNEPTAQEFEALFNLPYYQYNTGTLLAFNGTDIKTTDTDNNEYLTPLPISDYFPSGMKSAGTVYDELSESSAVTRIGTRAYQAGDENDPTVITDKTTTYYPLDNPQTVSFVSASFVSQNIETEMTAENGKLYAKSDGYTENAGTFPCKIKVASDGVAYSAEFKLHVERKP